MSRDKRSDSESDDKQAYVTTWVTAWAAFTVSFRHLYLWHDSCIEFKFVTYPGTHTRDNKLNIYQDHVHYIIISEYISLQIELFVPGIVYLILL